VTLDADDLRVRLQAKQGWAAAEGRSCVVVISTGLTPDLVAEGLAREVAHAINNCRKEMGCQYTDRVQVAAITPSAELAAAIDAFKSYVEQETLSVGLECVLLPEGVPSDAALIASRTSLAQLTEGAARFEMKIAGHPLVLYIKVVAGV